MSLEPDYVDVRLFRSRFHAAYVIENRNPVRQPTLTVPRTRSRPVSVARLRLWKAGGFHELFLIWTVQDTV